MSKDSQPKIEGYWNNAKNDYPEYRMPVENDTPWPGQTKFLTALTKVQATTHKVYYKGWSGCRLCGEHNGSAEFKSKEWIWPAGLRHYVEQHNVKPSPEFIAYILGA